jgi:hypothetical protein
MPFTIDETTSILIIENPKTLNFMENNNNESSSSDLNKLGEIVSSDLSPSSNSSSSSNESASSSHRKHLGENNNHTTSLSENTLKNQFFLMNGESSTSISNDASSASPVSIIPNDELDLLIKLERANK